MHDKDALTRFAHMSIGESATFYLDGDVIAIDDNASDCISDGFVEWNDETGVEYPYDILESTEMFHVSEFWDCAEHVARGLPCTLDVIREGKRVVMEYVGVYEYDTEFDDYDAVGWLVMSRIVDDEGEEEQ